MKRLDFLQTLGIGTTGLVLPEQWATRESLMIYDNYLRGMTHYSYKKIQKIIKEGDELTLKREPDNIHDRFAIEVYFQDKKIGYIAAFENVILANMLDAGVGLQAIVSRHDLNHERMHQSLSLAIYTDLLKPVNRSPIAQLPKRADDSADMYRQGHS